MRAKHVAVAAVVAAPMLFLFIVLGISFGNDPRAVPFGLKDKEAPAFNLEQLTGGQLDSASLKGQAVVLNFWSTWCVPCQAEHDFLQNGSRLYGDKVKFIGVLYQDEAVKARRYLMSKLNYYPQLLDPDTQLAIQYGVSGVPETYIIDPNGIVRLKLPGPIASPMHLTALINQALKEGLQ